MLEIGLAYGELYEVRRLFEEYAAWLGLDLSFQSYELLNLPGEYELPDGRLYLARVDGAPAACVALRRFDRLRCEMKRLFVREAFRGRGIARALSLRLMDDARDIGYSAMLLDTLSGMDEAVSLYRRLGFQEIPPYYNNPYKNVLYFEKDLDC